MYIHLVHSSCHPSIGPNNLCHLSSDILLVHVFYYSSIHPHNNCYHSTHTSLYHISNPSHTVLHKMIHQPISLFRNHVANPQTILLHNRLHWVILKHHTLMLYYSSSCLRIQFDQHAWKLPCHLLYCAPIHLHKRLHQATFIFHIHVFLYLTIARYRVLLIFIYWVRILLRLCLISQSIKVTSSRFTNLTAHTCLTFNHGVHIFASFIPSPMCLYFNNSFGLLFFIFYHVYEALGDGFSCFNFVGHLKGLLM